MEPNQFEISELTASKLIGCARNTAVKALAQLEDRGWITVVRVGRMFGNKATRASVYALTTYPTDDGKPASKAFLIWEPHPIQRLKIRPPTAQNITVNGSIQSQPRDIFREENHPVKH